MPNEFDRDNFAGVIGSVFTLKAAEGVTADLELLEVTELLERRDFNTQYYEGEWSGIALRAPANAHVALFPDPSADTYVDTDELARCPSVTDVLRKFECETESVRFLRLTTGSQIREHRDFGLSMEEGSARIHIPVQTSRDVEFRLDQRLLEMSEGEAWYINFDLPHSVANKGVEPRIHLVIDCIVNDWFESFFPKF